MTSHRHQCRSALQKGGLALLSAFLISTNAQTVAPSPASNKPDIATNTTTSVPTSPSWQQLTPQQKQALAPLGAQWSALTIPQQSKWLAISKNFSQLSISEQITMHTRMADWVALSPQQRNLARFNYNTVQNLPQEDKKAKWQAYQALSAEEKKQLSTVAQPPLKSAAPTAKPAEPHRLVQTPPRAIEATRDTPRPTTSVIDRKTLLPRQPVAVPANKSPASEAASPDAGRNATETAPS